MGRVRYAPTKAGFKIIDEGSPEYTFMQLIPVWYPGIHEAVLRARLGDELYERGFNIAMNNGWIIVVPFDGIFRTPRLTLGKDRIRENLLRVEAGEVLGPDEMRELRHRNLIKLILI